MSKFIDAEKVVYCKEIIADESGCMAEFYVAHEEDIKRLPPADVRPVVHAHWMERTRNGVTSRWCSACDMPFSKCIDEQTGERYTKRYYVNKTAFCPHCGAIMEEEEPSDGIIPPIEISKECLDVNRIVSHIDHMDFLLEEPEVDNGRK